MSLLDLAGQRGLVVGIANASSIAYGCAKAFHAAGAGIEITYLNAKAELYIRPPAENLASPIVPCDVATTMGFTALEGLPMGTRSGPIDPGVILSRLTELA
jgi:enoyl-[acyl-carrier-protein] reductase (NADH)